MLDHLLALFGSASTFEATDAVLFQSVIIADAVESEDSPAHFHSSLHVTAHLTYLLVKNIRRSCAYKYMGGWEVGGVGQLNRFSYTQTSWQFPC